ncbi:hypothetical protein [Flavilitoribacter nigricans]|uniref:Lipocalin-like domain-containing protein n=1 Tax=Flavilitoribacter nigricans (strain ATCC 23147 / DSM 23189 / NBRC 102662 / NCIMB 1420 / SS-2) TaxID=1122177 RepID=A0A2D0NH77_FLAN2|nr:hypothetical protein [Flavilitoribacter nigricans]PHN07837.1 hypothetical protein CRP01_03545 [Flavilitoribacter nigricans DSM 23189 = NBRC 102662]
MKKLFLLLLAVFGLLLSCAKTDLDQTLLEDHLVGNWTGEKVVITHLVENVAQCPRNSEVALNLAANGTGTYNGRAIEWSRTFDEISGREKVSFRLDGNSSFFAWIEVDEPHFQQWSGDGRVSELQVPGDIRWTLRKEGLEF